MSVRYRNEHKNIGDNLYTKVEFAVFSDRTESGSVILHCHVLKGNLEDWIDGKKHVQRTVLARCGKRKKIQ